MRLIDLHVDWLLQYANETTLFDASIYTRVGKRIAQAGGYPIEPGAGFGDAGRQVTILDPDLGSVADEEQASDALGMATGKRGREVAAVGTAGEQWARRAHLPVQEVSQCLDHTVGVRWAGRGLATAGRVDVDPLPAGKVRHRRLQGRRHHRSVQTEPRQAHNRAASTSGFHGQAHSENVNTNASAQWSHRADRSIRF